jgi:glycosyltransferase involved in cell wall biosynthesis
MIPPEISILLPFRDAAATLAEALDSTARQTFGNYELLAVDDGSADGSRELAASWAGRDERIRLLSPGRVGLVAALNLGIAEARGELIARMDADDLMRPERLAAQRAYLHDHPEVALVACQVALFPPEQIQAGYREYLRWQNACLSPREIADNIYVESPLAHPSVMLRRGVLEALGGYHDGPFPEDYELWLRMHAAGLAMAKLPQVLLDWRESPGRTSRVDPRYSRASFDRLRARFLAQDARLQPGRTLVVWGAGRRTRLRVRHLIDAGRALDAWVDIDPRKIGNLVWGLPVHPPAWLAREPKPFVLVYVSVHGARELIAGMLEPLGYRLGEDYLCVG